MNHKEFFDWLEKHSGSTFKRNWKDIEADLREECAEEKDESLEFIANMPVPTFVKDALIHDHEFEKAIAKLVEKGRQSKSIEEIDKLTLAVLRLAKQVEFGLMVSSGTPSYILSPLGHQKPTKTRVSPCQFLVRIHW